MFRINKSIETEGKLVVARDWRQAEWNVTTNEYRFSYWVNKNILELDCGGWPIL